jgi:hypothetical protein
MRLAKISNEQPEVRQSIEAEGISGSPQWSSPPWSIASDSTGGIRRTAVANSPWARSAFSVQSPKNGLELLTAAIAHVAVSPRLRNNVLERRDEPPVSPVHPIHIFRSSTAVVAPRRIKPSKETSSAFASWNGSPPTASPRSPQSTGRMSSAYSRMVRRRNRMMSSPLNSILSGDEME